MNTQRIFLGLAACVLLGFPAHAQDVSGNWQGTLDAGSATLRIVVHLTKSDGGLTGTMDSPDQGSYDIPVASATVKDAGLKLDVPAIGGSYEGHISADLKTIDGTWSQAGRSFPLGLKRLAGTEAAAAARTKKPGGPVFPDEETWEGTLQTGGPNLRLVLHLAKSEGGGLRAVLDSVDQGAYGIPIASATEKDGTLKLELPSIKGSYEGKVSVDHQTIDGTWSQAGGNLPLIFRRRGVSDDAKKTAGRPSGTAGIWQGVLEAGGARLRLQLHIFADQSGKFTGKLDSLDQGANGLACANISLKGDSFHFEVPSVGGSYDGALNATQDQIAGKWTQHGSTLALDFKRSDRAAELRRPQNPAKPYPYEEEEVTYPNAKAGITIAGTLTIPRGAGPFPAALLIAGSGPQTRDEVVFGHSVFLVLADHLTRRGVAVLRADKRGVGKSAGNYSLATSVDFADDAEAGVGYLKTRKEINAKEIGLVGHSEGGIVAPMVANRLNDVAWVVLLAGDAVKGDDVLLLQGQLINKASGATNEELAKDEDLKRKSFAILREEKDAAATQQKLSELYENDSAAKGMSTAQRQTAIQFFNSPWFRYFMDYDPAPALKKLTCPVLALYGSKDLQVAPAQNLPVLKEALRSGGNKDFQAEELPGLNHLFQHATTGAIGEYGGIEETMAPLVLDEVSGWILRHVALGAG